jgi:hypothetical protein
MLVEYENFNLLGAVQLSVLLLLSRRALTITIIPAGICVNEVLKPYMTSAFGNFPSLMVKLTFSIPVL